MSTIVELKDKVADYKKDCWDDVVNFDDVTFGGEGTNLIMRHKDRDFSFKKIGYNQLLTTLRMPTTYFKRCPVEFTREHINHWKKEHKSKDRFFRFKGDSVRAVLGPNYRPIDNNLVIDSLEKEMGNLEIKDYRLDDGAFSVRIVDQDKPLERGDLLSGYNVMNSEVGLCALRNAFMLYRCVCSNGMLVPMKGFGYRDRIVHRGRREGEVDVRDYFNVSLVKCHEFFDVIEKAKNDSLAEYDPTHVSKRALIKALGKYINTDMSSKAISYAESEFGNYTRWSVANGVSHVSQSFSVYNQNQYDTLSGKLLTGKLLSRAEVVQCEKDV